MKNTGKKKVKILKDGPYELDGDIEVDAMCIDADDEGESVGWIQGRRYGASHAAADKSSGDPPIHLCRCGHSHNMPFCDGTHKTVEFHGKEQADRPSYLESAEVHRGEAVDLLDDPALCVGARFCDVGKTVWRYARDSADPKNKEMAIQEACKCPAGRLTVREKDGTLVEPKLEQKVSAIEDAVNDCRGPLWVQGGIEVEGANGEKYETRNRVALCRCGESSNQPYCDGSHYNCRHMRGRDK